MGTVVVSAARSKIATLLRAHTAFADTDRITVHRTWPGENRLQGATVWLGQARVIAPDTRMRAGTKALDFTVELDIGIVVYTNGSDETDQDHQAAAELEAEALLDGVIDVIVSNVTLDGLVNSIVVGEIDIESGPTSTGAACGIDITVRYQAERTTP